jgi:hypothetical protein
LELKEIFPAGEGFLDLKSRERDAILQEIVQHLVRIGELSADKEELLLRKLYAREEIQSSDIGGFALPSAKIEDGLLNRSLVGILGYSSDPLFWHPNSPFELNCVCLLLSDRKSSGGRLVEVLSIVGRLPNDLGPNGYNLRRKLNGK